MTARNHGGPSPKRKRLPIAALQTDPMTFQFREQELTPHHVDDLVDALKAGKELDPMTAWVDQEGRYIVTDGHHRLAAYQAVDWQGKVLVEVYTCDRAEARLLALAENAKARLPMTHTAKANAAWALVCDEFAYSKRQIVDATGISNGTVATMRRVKKLLDAEDEGLPEDWKQALRASQGKEPREMTDDMAEAMIQHRTKQLDDLVGKHIGHMAELQWEAIARMLERRMGQKIRYLVEEWRDDEEEDDLPF
ncbi:ParB/RepB/Spo0J family partition protein [Aliiroseovarius marinus]|uniref:ParB/RepB/Spo0J family partition protein n=1 Tax=Aliiroseovarius marinus TaxID=2500159 RepID=UPI001061396F|nr:ParB N-terminal domain-containing protein [Aliiroseovarius marinus]